MSFTPAAGQAVGRIVPPSQRTFLNKDPRPGYFILTPRATDSAGNTQPDKIPCNFRGHANNSIHTIAVEVPGASGFRLTQCVSLRSP